MLRHMGFKTKEGLEDYFINNPPKHAYASGSLDDKPDAPDMDKKHYKANFHNILRFIPNPNDLL